MALLYTGPTGPTGPQSQSKVNLYGDNRGPLAPKLAESGSYCSPNHQTRPGDEEAIELLQKYGGNGPQDDDSMAAFFQYVEDHKVLPLKSELHYAWAIHKQQQKKGGRQEAKSSRGQNQPTGKENAPRDFLAPQGHGPCKAHGPSCSVHSLACHPNNGHQASCRYRHDCDRGNGGG
jgi:hypothetical protein